VLLNEASHFLESRGMADDFVEPTLENSVPEYAAKKALVTKAGQARAIIRDDVRMVRHGIRAGAAPRTPLLRPDNYDPDREH
jgi:hypothetical protein